MFLGSAQPLTEMSKRNIPWGCKGGRCLGLTTLTPSCAGYLEVWEPRTSGTLWLQGLRYFLIIIKRVLD